MIEIHPAYLDDDAHALAGTEAEQAELVLLPSSDVSDSESCDEPVVECSPSKNHPSQKQTPRPLVEQTLAIKLYPDFPDGESFAVPR